MTRFSYSLIEPRVAWPAIGLIVLQADETLETDMRRSFTTQECDIHFSRIESATEVSPDSLAAMEGGLTGSASLFPAGLELAAVGYGCTSATSVIGPDRVHALIGQGCRTRAVTEPVSALIHGCRMRSITRLAFLSPYVAAVSDRLRDVLAEQGVATPVFGSFDEAEEARVARIDERSLFDAATALGRDPSVEGVFLSCTNLKTLDVLGRIEDAIGKPALSSNSVLIAHLRHLAGL